LSHSIFICVGITSVVSPIILSFLSLISPPPISTLFPYTTLFRSVGRYHDHHLLRKQCRELQSSLQGCITHDADIQPVFQQCFDLFTGSHGVELQMDAGMLRTYIANTGGSQSITCTRHKTASNAAD